jgi:nicotinamidase-related amidase
VDLARWSRRAHGDRDLEVQNGVVGERSALPALAEIAERDAPAPPQLLPGARAAGVQVVHCTAYRRADGKGANTNARLFLGRAEVAGRAPARASPGGGGAGRSRSRRPPTLVLTRTHGLDPMAGTDLDPGAAEPRGAHAWSSPGVSVNVAVTNLVMTAVNHGYDVVLPRDAVCGIPTT